MQIKLKSNRKWVTYAFLPTLCICILFSLLMIIGLIIAYDDMKNSLGILIMFLVMTCIQTSIILFAKYKKGKSYIFDEKEIAVFNKEILKFKIQIINIERMTYDVFKWYYIFGMIFSPTVPTLSIYIKEKGGEEHRLGFISFKDAKRLKEMYPNLLTL